MFGFWMMFIFSNQTSTGKCKEMAQLYANIPLDSFTDRPDHLPLFCPICILNHAKHCNSSDLSSDMHQKTSQEIGQKY